MTDTGYWGTTEWARFSIPASEWTPTGVIRRVNQSDEQKAAAAARLSALRGNQPEQEHPTQPPGP